MNINLLAGNSGDNSGYSLSFSIGSTYGSYARNRVILGFDAGGDFSGSYRRFAKDAGAGNGTLPIGVLQ